MCKLLGEANYNDNKLKEIENELLKQREEMEELKTKQKEKVRELKAKQTETEKLLSFCKSLPGFSALLVGLENSAEASEHIAALLGDSEATDATSI